ncbi:MULTISPECIES: restriction endonuclease [unclassified Streptomyces]|uniref:restriction endonuclease n=1 Tax=unclassified Streptomyces TaxID=2593676 RepID=UPI002254128A|nr:MULTISPECIES: restriction endonuclease [unclassified Streptomyces]WSP56215.1 restriction endonuclease [Streptomyces sp. NBC_01241]WSU23086.1 restriction endonuclease [Streptomyces sp. NBC_01108]MCX4787925.1 restriction endonuclease [Streptomyces sp. NBC_01221]MCX4796313.1 restriction endonuclease [Streptomyces sp. NBC_01242]WSJ37554.1 restriction endonuclease [Streptomyces sp. NBC_01321]
MNVINDAVLLVINDAVLLESRSLRASIVERTEALDRVKVLSLLPDGMHVTTAMVAAYFQVGIKAIESLVVDHRQELEANGYRVLTGTELTSFKEVSGIQSRSRALALYSRRTVLNVAMLLRDSEVARQTRTYLLDMEYVARNQPVDNSVHRGPESLDDRIDRRITHILGTTVVPMFNALIEASGEHLKELISLRDDVAKVEQKLCNHHHRLRHLEHAQGPRPYTGIMASIDAMNWREFEHHVAVLLRRDGCTDVVVHGGPGDRGVDVTAVTADGRSIVVQCKSFAPYRPVWSGELQKFLGASFVQHGADVALFVATTSFTPDARAIAETYGITLVDRAHLEKWSAGVPLRILR